MCTQGGNEVVPSLTGLDLQDPVAFWGLLPDTLASLQFTVPIITTSSEKASIWHTIKCSEAKKTVHQSMKIQNCYSKLIFFHNWFCLGVLTTLVVNKEARIQFVQDIFY